MPSNPVPAMQNFSDPLALHSPSPSVIGDAPKRAATGDRVDAPPARHSFSDFSLSPALARAVADLGYAKPSPIQERTLPILLGNATDFVGLAATGTGKTAAFAIPLLEKIDPNTKAVQGLVLCPTRELAMQVAGQIDLLGKYKDLRALPIYGGAGYRDQFIGLKNGTAVVVGTPGRIIDHIQKGSLKLDALKVLILDEADEMISMGFKDELEAILSAVPREQCHNWLFSATMSRDVRKVADEYLRNPEQVQINRTEMVPTAIEQLYYLTHEGNKPEVLCKLIDNADDFYGIVFCQTKTLVTDLSEYLQTRGYKVDCLHGDKNQSAREKTMQAFRARKVTVMVCTDVAARGLDVKDVTHVINYSIPRELDNYVHRIGRTARSGKTGIAMSLVTPSHRGLIFQIEKRTKSRLQEGRIPSRKEIGAKKLTRALARFQEQTAFARAVELLDDSWKEALAGMSGEEIAGRFLTLAFPEVFNGKDVPQMVNTSRSRESGVERRTSGKYPRPRHDFSSGEYSRRAPARGLSSDESEAGGGSRERRRQDRRAKLLNQDPASERETRRRHQPQRDMGGAPHLGSRPRTPRTPSETRSERRGGKGQAFDRPPRRPGEGGFRDRVI